MNQPPQSSGAAPISITSPNPDPETTIRAAAFDAVAAQAKEYINKILLYLLVAVLGAVAAVVWDLNGEVYKAVGEVSVSAKLQDFEVSQLRQKIDELKEEMVLQKCLADKNIKDKARCYHDY